MKNYGFQEPVLVPEDYSFGSIGGEVLQENSSWLDFLPEFEHQRKGFDTQSCVSFGTLSALEMLHKRKWDIEPNYSDRFTSKMAETTPTGNTPKKVAHSIRHDGTVTEPEWPFTEVNSWDEYFVAIPSYLLRRGQTWLNNYDFGYEYVGDSEKELREALKYSPVGVSVHAWQQNNEGYYMAGRLNHWCVLVAYDALDRPIVFDTYENHLKTLVKDYPFKWAMRYSLEKRLIPRGFNWLIDLWHRFMSIFKV